MSFPFHDLNPELLAAGLARVCHNQAMLPLQPTSLKPMQTDPPPKMDFQDHTVGIL